MEDFVTFEIAQKLKEKGFNEPCYGYYHLNGGDDSFELCGNDSFDFLNSLNRFRIAAPFISQVLKWLREAKGIHIDIAICKSKYIAMIVFIDKPDQNIEHYNETIWEDERLFDTYEKSAIAGIEYVLNNLI
jgi:hypothetical protein